MSIIDTGEGITITRRILLHVPITEVECIPLILIHRELTHANLCLQAYSQALCSGRFWYKEVPLLFVRCKLAKCLV